MTKRTWRITAAAVAATLALAGCGTAVADSMASSAEQNAQREVAGLFDGWNAALATGDPAVVTARYADDAILLPTVAAGVHDTPAEISEYFTEFLTKKPVGTVTESDVRVFGDDLAKHSGLYTFRLSPAGKPATTVAARFTFVYERDAEGQWRILEHHSSAEPVTAA